MRYNATDDDPIAQVQSAGASIGEDTEEDIKEALRAIAQKAVDNGLSDKGKQRLVQMINQNQTVFRIKAGTGPSSKGDTASH